MATTSFLKSVTLRTRRQSAAFLRALESSASSTQKPTRYTKTVKDLTPAQIRKVFGKE